MWQKAHQSTVDNLVESNQWPKDVPIPIYWNCSCLVVRLY
jgi:hypothetical protein